MTVIARLSPLVFPGRRGVRGGRLRAATALRRGVMSVLPLNGGAPR